MSVLWDKISALEAQLRAVEAERDETGRVLGEQMIWLSKSMSVMGHGADQARWPKGMHVIDALIRERNKLEAERDELRAAVRAFLEDASMPQCGACREQGVIRIVTRQYRGWFACDQHDSGLGWKDLPHAASLRALRALLGGAS